MESNTLRALLAEAEAQLRAVSEQPRREAEALLEAIAAVTRAAVVAEPARTLPDAVAAQLRAAIARRAAGEPLAYISGWRGFWNFDLEVSAAVLVPRPETEGLVERALQLAAAHGSAVDLGTGSGAIAIAFASERPHWQVAAVELSPAAFAIATRNAARLLPGRLRLLQGSWFEPLAGERFSLVMSNPPYIDATDAALADPALRHEPQLALTPGPDGLAALRAIVAAAPAHLLADGVLLLEHGATQGAAVRALLEARGFSHVVSHRDLAGHERVSEGRWLLRRTDSPLQESDS
jgi:release factor glutamine methyltransferase